MVSDDISWGLTPEYPSCQTIDVTKLFDFNMVAPIQIYFYFFMVENIAVSIHIEEKNKALRRPLKESKCTIEKIQKIPSFFSAIYFF